ncbi:short-chain dehydrogenase/reductase SDR [Pseudopedobacter saltans DSM 12145]|uniref:Enoyl-[acyl-carrier-protein] reductase [NADH] n=1 Tax=Pseudopedobacter saltans (strain ATCC 51119 / DSM 12145 / JCM 21818 / CCUG 39354 / LMG 10337 / NBRC 100064 / NCIMB 13643) TaxID=762903 RepID=F0S822_PSESL|nr:SDR family oxidoreductase [Pseudopedobacter saltans]ADY51243.1 short-chain dehydrogenase/reductase SDR [Pseudopedobacter saltans DSM 12145]
MIDNKNKIAVVFGVRNESSIAFHIALRLHQSGCKVVLNYVNNTKDEVLYLLEKHNMDTSYAAEVDVKDEGQISSFLEKIYKELGPIHYLLHGVAFGNQNVLCYSIPGSGKPTPSYIDIPLEDFVDSFDISAYSLLRISRVAEPLLAENASILTLTYNASQRVFPAYAGMAINKAALENIMMYLSSYFRKSAVRVNAISAGLVMTTSAGGINGVRKLRKVGKFTAPLGNVDASDVADTALYYFSDLSKKVTGNIHYVDGGFNIMGVSKDEE